MKFLLAFIFLSASCSLMIPRNKLFLTAEPVLTDGCGEKIFSGEQENKALEESVAIIRKRLESKNCSIEILKIENKNIILSAKTRIKTEKILQYLFTDNRIELRYVDEELTKTAENCLPNMNIQTNKIASKTYRLEFLSNLLKKIGEPKTTADFMDTGDGKIHPVILTNDVILSNRQILSANLRKDDFGNYRIGFTTSKDGTRAICEATSSQNRGKMIAIIVNGRIKAAPRIIQQITSDKFDIIGIFSKEEAESLTDSFSPEILPVTFKITDKHL